MLPPPSSPIRSQSDWELRGGVACGVVWCRVHSGRGWPHAGAGWCVARLSLHARDAWRWQRGHTPFSPAALARAAWCTPACVAAAALPRPAVGLHAIGLPAVVCSARVGVRARADEPGMACARRRRGHHPTHLLPPLLLSPAFSRLNALSSLRSGALLGLAWPLLVTASLDGAERSALLLLAPHMLLPFTLAEQMLMWASELDWGTPAPRTRACNGLFSFCFFS